VHINITKLAGLLLGCLFGIITAFDGYLSDVAAKQINLSILNKNIFKLFPYETTLLFLFCILGTVILIKLVSYCVVNSERSFLFLFIIGLQSIALSYIGRLDFSEAALIFFFLVVVMKSLTRVKQAIFTGLDLVNLLFAAAVLLSSVNGGPLIFLSSSFTMVKFILIILLVVNFIKSRDDIVFSMKLIVIVTTVSAIIAIGQEILYLLTGLPLVGIVNKATLRLMFEEAFGTTFLRVPAFFGSYKSFTFFLNTALLIVFNYYIYNRPFKTREKILLFFSFIIMSTALLLTFSNDGFLSLFIGIIFSVLIWRPRLVIHFSLLTMSLIVIITIFSYWDNIYNSLNAELRYGEQRVRVQTMKDGITGYFHRNQLLGAGVTRASRYTGHFFRWPVHNSLVEAADDTGIVGLFAYLGLLGYSFFRLLRTNLTVVDESYKWIARALLFSFISFFISLQFHPFYLEKFNWLLISLIQTFVLAFDQRNSEDSTPQADGNEIKIY